ncbi:MAG TPA: hypothetical protein VND24_07115, partial [Steroidobacteraceae bacterium]|nr:hypothetical protein [Steroidobacteraceae bacterium]
QEQIAELELDSDHGASRDWRRRSVGRFPGLASGYRGGMNAVHTPERDQIAMLPVPHYSRL